MPRRASWRATSEPDTPPPTIRTTCCGPIAKRPTRAEQGPVRIRPRGRWRRRLAGPRLARRTAWPGEGPEPPERGYGQVGGGVEPRLLAAMAHRERWGTRWASRRDPAFDPPYQGCSYTLSVLRTGERPSLSRGADADGETQRSGFRRCRARIRRFQHPPRALWRPAAPPQYRPPRAV